MMVYAPFLVTTLCRYEHLKKCLESLSANPWAKYTPVYVALDFPFKDKHWDGYNKIKEFLKGDFNFKELNVIERKTNFGPYDNSCDAMEQIFLKYDRIIVSEDDNVFSQNFLEYTDKGLEKFETASDVLAISGYMLSNAAVNTKLLHNDNNFVKQRISFAVAVWGYGIWKNRWQELKTIKFKKYAEKNLRFPNGLFLFFRYPKIFWMSMRVIYNDEDVLYDLAISLFMFNENKFVVQPVISKVRNEGFDGYGGITSGRSTAKWYCEQIFDDNQTFSFIGEDKNIRRNEKIMNKIGPEYFPAQHMGKRAFFRFLFRYFILKIFGLDFLKKMYPIHSWGPKAFSKMRSMGVDNVYEILEYEHYPKINITYLSLQNRKLYIWGAGADAFKVRWQCETNKWKIEAFLDSNSQISDFHGYKVLPPHELLNSESKDFFIVISSRKYAEEIANICEQAGLKKDLDFWRPNVK